MHPRVEHPSPRVEFTCIMLNATVRNVINDFTVTAKDSGPYYTTQCVNIDRFILHDNGTHACSLSKNVTFFLYAPCGTVPVVICHTKSF